MSAGHSVASSSASFFLHDDDDRNAKRARAFLRDVHKRINESLYGMTFSVYAMN